MKNCSCWRKEPFLPICILLNWYLSTLFCRYFSTPSQCQVNRQESGYITEVSSHIFVHVIGLLEGKNSQHEQVKVPGVSCPSCHAQSNRMNFNFSFQYPKLLLWLLAFLIEVLSGLKKLPQKQEFWTLRKHHFFKTKCRN